LTKKKEAQNWNRWRKWRWGEANPSILGKKRICVFERPSPAEVRGKSGKGGSPVWKEKRAQPELGERERGNISLNNEA